MWAMTCRTIYTLTRPLKLIQQVAHSFLHVLTSNGYKPNACHLHLLISAIVSTPSDQVTRRFPMESDSGQYCRICFCGVDYSCHGVAPSLAVGWESFVVEWGL